MSINWNAIIAPFQDGIPKLFGNGLLGSAVTGIGRITAFFPSLIAVTMVAELALRGLQNTLRGIGLEPKEDSWIAKAGAQIAEHGARPYQKVDVKTLAIRALAFAAIGIVGSESMRILGGNVPPVYNRVLSLLGPIRISSDPYVQGAVNTLAHFGIVRMK